MSGSTDIVSNSDIASFPPRGLFADLLGASFTRLGARIRDVHDGRSQCLQGTASVTRGRSLLARAICRLASLPHVQTDGPVRVDLDVATDGETWTRRFGDSAPMRSVLRACGGLLAEQLGPLQLRFRLREAGGNMEWLLESVRLLGIPAPRAWLQQTTARCTQREGRYCFEVNVTLPFVGHVVGYRGSVERRVVDAARGDLRESHG